MRLVTGGVDSAQRDVPSERGDRRERKMKRLGVRRLLRGVDAFRADVAARAATGKDGGVPSNGGAGGASEPKMPEVLERRARLDITSG